MLGTVRARNLAVRTLGEVRASYGFPLVGYVIMPEHMHVHTREKMKEKLEYMHANPVKEKLVQHPRDWPWSSWSDYATGKGLLNMDVL